MSGGAWVNIGPAPIQGTVFPGVSIRAASGRVAAVAVDPRSLSHWFIGAAQGGVWETRDRGTTWTNRTDDEASLAMGAIAIAPSSPDVMYAGTGEANFSSDSYGGAGLLKSMDGGARWTLLASSKVRHLATAAIVVDPANASVLLVAMTTGSAGRGADFVSTAATGVYKSSDGGVNVIGSSRSAA